MLMKRWRVGSLTMGLVLIASGITLMISLLTRVNLFNVILVAWPIILVALGIEILVHLFVKKDEDVKIRYDGLSIVFISVLLMFSLLFYAATFAVGFIGEQDDWHSALGIWRQEVIVQNEIMLNNANELVLMGGEMNVRVIPTSNNNIRISYIVTTSTNDREATLELLSGIFSVNHSERAHLMVNSAVRNNNRTTGRVFIDVVIHLPNEAIVDISQFHWGVRYDSVLREQIVGFDHEWHD